MTRLATTIEAILYLKGQPVSIAEIAEIAKCDRTDVEDAIIGNQLNKEIFVFLAQYFCLSIML